MKSCKDCIDFGYTKENGQHVCRYGLNFNQRTQAYDPGYAARCKSCRTGQQGLSPETIIVDEAISFVPWPGARNKGLKVEIEYIPSMKLIRREKIFRMTCVESDGLPEKGWFFFPLPIPEAK